MNFKQRTSVNLSPDWTFWCSILNLSDKILWQNFCLLYVITSYHAYNIEGKLNSKLHKNALKGLKDVFGMGCYQNFSSLQVWNTHFEVLHFKFNAFLIIFAVCSKNHKYKCLKRWQGLEGKVI